MDGSMKEGWDSIEDIEREFDVSGADGDLREIRRMLRARLKDVHPDANEGHFGSDGDESEFHRIKSAIEFVDRKLLTGLPVQNNQTALMVATQFSEAIATSFADARSQDRELEKARQLQEKQRATKAKGRRSRTKKRAEFFKQLSPQMNDEMFKIGSAPGESDGEIFSGIPVRRIFFRNGGPDRKSEVTRVARQDFDSNLFEAPSGFRKEAMPSMPGMR